MSRVIDAIPFYAEAHMIMADIQYRRKNYRSALEHLSGAVEYGFFGKSTRAMLIKKRGISAYRLGKYQQAGEDFRKLIKMGYGSRSIRSLLAATLVRQEEYSDALPLLTGIYREDPKNLSLIYQIGSLYYKIGDDRYTTYFDRLWELTKTDSELKEKYHRAYELLIDHHYSQKNYQKVTRIYQSLPENIRDSRLKKMAAMSHYQQKEYDRSIELLDQIYLAREDRFILARACALSDRTTRARELVQDLAEYSDMKKKIEDDPALGPLLASINRERREKEEKRKQEEAGTEDKKPDKDSTAGNDDDPGKE
jgi:tetratricopeptide (TPR) repeat protein